MQEIASTRRLLKHPAERRQLGIVAAYWGLLFVPYFVPSCRHPLVFAAACCFSFLNCVVIHNHLHQGVFVSRRLNDAFRCVLSFGALYPASANVASHNLVHHHFDDDGQPDWAAPTIVSFRWNLLNLVHFPNVAGPQTFAGVQRWARTLAKPDFLRQYRREQVVAFGLTGLLLAFDFWGALFFVVMPQLWGARGILRINLIQHDGCDTTSEWNHSRNFVGRGFNWLMCNNGFHTIHHNKAGLHWSALAEAHEREARPRVHASLDEPSMLLYLLRTYLLCWARPVARDVALAERGGPSGLASRAVRREQAASDAGVSHVEPSRMVLAAD